MSGSDGPQDAGFYYLNDARFDVGSEFDPDRSYLIASSPRSGSSLLARALWNRGTAGLPHEYFQRHHRHELAERWGVTGDLEAYVARLLRSRSTGNGVFGFKAHFPQIEEAFLGSGTDPFETFPALSVVYLYRSDRVSQAVSLERASRSGVWTDERGAWQEQDAVAGYRYRPLWRRLQRILDIEAAWEDYFASRRIEPLRLRFEDLVAAVQPTVDRVLDHLGVEHRGAAPNPLPELGSQHDPENEDLARQFTADLARRARPRRDSGD